ncbi:hypothetical protein FT641_20035 [Bacillus paranthracis]|uniref:hypothetical protein n=1 Tax=Bacillus paranthracis TaxID=2026186 RepID=UPI00187993A7|nr:hypothetical protein [Bacillus paranthracis]MBE7114648.1 hypothetical protein [Bacillus paranthracis]MBE7154985.1 hypothetical protein [Bacillus paranthracis]
MCKKWINRLVTVMLVMIGALLGSYIMTELGISGAKLLMNVLIIGLLCMLPIAVALSVTDTVINYFRNKKIVKGDWGE